MMAMCFGVVDAMVAVCPLGVVRVLARWVWEGTGGAEGSVVDAVLLYIAVFLWLFVQALLHTRVCTYLLFRNDLASTSWICSPCVHMWSTNSHAGFCRISQPTSVLRLVGSFSSCGSERILHPHLESDRRA
jgi:hypothetical protein